MAYKDVLCPVFRLDADDAALTAAGEIAGLFDARAVALIVAVHLASDYADTPHKLSEVLADIAAGARSEAARERERITAWLDKAAYGFEVRDVGVEGAVEQGEAEAHALIADLVVMQRADQNQRARRAFIERVLFRAGRPMLLAPSGPVRARRWKRFVIGWNAKAEAMHAVTASVPLLRQADEVIVATVDAGAAEPAPGHELAEHLLRHGAPAKVRNLDSIGREVERVLLDEAAAIDADALILGAYGHSRAREMLFGGVTRALLKEAPIPLLMAH